MKKAIPIAIAFLALIQGSFAQQLLTSHGSDDRYPRWSPNGDEIVFETKRDGNWEIYKIDRDGAGLTRLTDHDADDRRATWHPSGAWILFESNRTGRNELYTLQLETQEVEKLAIHVEADILFAEYSPDGRALAFTANRNLYTATSSGQQVKQITFDSTRSLYPVWSPDQGKIAFFSRRDTAGETDEIYTYRLADAKIERLTEWPTHNFAPSWSPMATHLICATSMEGSRPEFYLIDVASKSLQRVTNNDFGDTEPHWSPTDNTIAYACYKNGSYDICLMSVDDFLEPGER